MALGVLMTTQYQQRGKIGFGKKIADNLKKYLRTEVFVTAYGIVYAKTVISTFLSLMVTTLAGYALKRQESPESGNPMLITYHVAEV